MDALDSRLRLRLAAIAEWIIAAVFLIATVAVAGMILKQLGAQPRPSPAAASVVPVNVPAAIPARATAVPVLPLADGKELRIGDTIAAVAARLGRAAESGRQAVDRGIFGERLTRFYEYAGARFILVFEQLERGGDVKVAAIYLQ